MNHVRHLLEMIRFSHTLFALPFALLSAVLAWGTPRPDGQSMPFRPMALMGIVLCMVFARSAAMAFNRLVDRDVDALNPRTAMRHLPAGILSVKMVAWFALGNGLAFIAACGLFWPNPWPLRLAVPVLALLLGYSYAKRFTALSHYWLGMALMAAPVCAWIALRGDLIDQYPADLLPAGILGCAVMLWVAGFDIIYACQDVDFDRQQGLRSMPVRWGVAGALRWAAISHAAMLCALFALPWLCPQLGLGPIYQIGLVLVTLLITYEHWLVRPDDLSRINQAFFQVNAVISLGLLVIGTMDVMW